MIAGSRPSRFTVNVPVVSASASNWQVLHLVWCGFQEFCKKVKNYSRKSRWFTNHAKVNAYFMDHGKIENSFPRTEKYRFTNHGKNKSSFTLHAKQKWPFTCHEKGIGDPLAGQWKLDWYNKGPTRDGKTHVAIRFRSTSIGIILHIFNYYRGEEDRSFYRGLR